jgi:hypothetical protein
MDFPSERIETILDVGQFPFQIGILLGHILSPGDSLAHRGQMLIQSRRFLSECAGDSAFLVQLDEVRVAVECRR